MSDDLYGDDAEVLEISEDAVRAWVTAWREFADSLQAEADEARDQSAVGSSWGDLGSIQQLERIYRDHLGGGTPESLAGRIMEFAEEAKRMAHALESQYLAFGNQDTMNAQALDNGER